jgi:hypothetical protein
MNWDVEESGHGLMKTKYEYIWNDNIPLQFICLVNSESVLNNTSERSDAELKTHISILYFLIHYVYLFNQK